MTHSPDTERPLRIGIDVGGTNTDAVVIDNNDQLLVRTKQATSTDVTTGIRNALGAVLEQLGADDARRVGRVMLGTTHATNAILQRRNLGRVGVLRLGYPASTSTPPLCTWPRDLVDTVAVDYMIAAGGHFIDGYPISELDERGIRTFLTSLKGRVDALALTGIFSPVSRDQENAVADIARTILGPHVPISISHELGSLGLLERENATVLNASLYKTASDVTTALHDALQSHGLNAVTYFAQNDGTLMDLDFAARYPVLTIGSGPANSLRGAAFLSGVENAIVADVGGTSTDLGVLVGGFPRESAAAVEIGGVRTNFRMPDILAIAIGGGTIVEGTADAPAVGPRSVGYRIREEAIAFGGSTLTLSDVAIASGRASFGDTQAAASTDAALVAAALARTDAMVADAVDQMSLGKNDLPLVAVGGGAFLIPTDAIDGRTVLRPANGDVANAVGAAIALASGRWETIAPAGPGRDDAINDARARARMRAIQAGADPDNVEITEITETPLAYLDEPAVRIEVKAAGPLGAL